MIKKSLIKLGYSAAIIGILLSCNVNVKAAEKHMKSAKEVTKEMGVGWNLGNTLDSWATNTSWFDASDPKGWETCWGNPVTTKAMIDKVKEAGFTTIRVPVTWGYHMGSAPDYTINSAWMERVKEVVNYGIEDGMYVILNAHHESEWCIPTKAKENECSQKLKSLWTQVAENFKDYDDHLIFEVQNEPRLVGSQEEWIGGTSEGREVVNDYNEVGLKAIRDTGGNNSVRAVMMPTYGATGLDQAINDYRVPEDKNVIVSLHAYSPYFFAMTTDGTKEWGSDSDKASLEAELTKYHNFFEAKGVPVVMGEFGTIDKNNLSARVEHAKVYASTCSKLGMPCVWWDNNYLESGKDNTFRLLDRNTLNWTFPELRDALVNSYNSQVKILLGDVNGDGKIDIRDYSLLRKYINAGNTTYKVNVKNADINHDGKINFVDLAMLKKAI